MARTQRVIALIDNFMDYHEQGFSIMEIAKIFNVDFSTVYNYLQEIADKNNVTRESLLEKPTSGYSSRLSFHKERVELKELEDGFKELNEKLEQLISNIDKILTNN